MMNESLVLILHCKGCCLALKLKEEMERASLQIKNTMFLFQYKGKTHTLDQTFKILKVSTTKKKVPIV